MALKSSNMLSKILNLFKHFPQKSHSKLSNIRIVGPVLPHFIYKTEEVDVCQKTTESSTPSPRIQRCYFTIITPMDPQIEIKVITIITLKMIKHFVRNPQPFWSLKYNLYLGYMFFL